MTCRIAFLALSFTFAATACKDKAPGSAGASGAAPSSSASSAASAASPSSFEGPHRTHPEANTSDRVVGARFVRKGGGPKNTPVFALTNLTREPLKVKTAWTHYYTPGKKEDYAYAVYLKTPLELGPGETKETPLGDRFERDGKDIVVEAEVSNAVVGSKPWRNDNLALASRPLGGFDAKALADHTGERLLIDVYSRTERRVRLTNTSDRPVSSFRAVLYYRMAKDETEARATSHMFAKPLAPGQSVDVDLEFDVFPGRNPPAGALLVTAYASEVGFTDGSRFQNKNLEGGFAWQPAS